MASRFATVSKDKNLAMNEAAAPADTGKETKSGLSVFTCRYPLGVGSQRQIYTSTLRVSVYINHYSPLLRGIVVYYSSAFEGSLYSVQGSVSRKTCKLFGPEGQFLNQPVDLRQHSSVVDLGEGPGGPRPPLFLGQTEAQRAGKKFLETASPPSEGLDPPVQFLAHKPVNFASLSDTFIVSWSKRLWGLSRIGPQTRFGKTRHSPGVS